MTAGILTIVHVDLKDKHTLLDKLPLTHSRHCKLLRAYAHYGHLLYVLLLLTRQSLSSQFFLASTISFFMKFSCLQ